MLLGAASFCPPSEIKVKPYAIFKLHHDRMIRNRLASGANHPKSRSDPDTESCRPLVAKPKKTRPKNDAGAPRHRRIHSARTSDF
jgi:hypothetical protein